MASLPETEVKELPDETGIAEQVSEIKDVLREVKDELRGMLTLLEKDGRKGN
jgi:hypothetical protein